MNDIYLNATMQQGHRGAPIFLTNLVLAKYTYTGAAKRVKKEFLFARKIVASGTLEQIKNDPKILLACLVKLYGKEKAFKSEKEKYKIEDEVVQYKKDGVLKEKINTYAIEIISFHGYSHHK